MRALPTRAITTLRHPEASPAVTTAHVSAACVLKWQRDHPLLNASTRVVVGEQTDIRLLSELTELEAPWDLVIDDGSHNNQMTLPTFFALFPFVAAGGMYFIEDMQTSWRFLDAKPLGTPGTSIALFKNLMQLQQCEATTRGRRHERKARDGDEIEDSSRSHEGERDARRRSWACLDIAVIECRLEHCVVVKQ